MQNLPGDSNTSALPAEGWKEMYSPTCRELDAVVFDIWFDSYITGHSDRPNYNKSLTNHRIRMSLKEGKTTLMAGTGRFRWKNGTVNGERATAPSQDSQGRIFSPSARSTGWYWYRVYWKTGHLLQRRWHKFNWRDNDRERARERQRGWN